MDLTLHFFTFFPQMRAKRPRIPRVKPEYNEKGDQVYCICRDVDDGSMMVQCDYCKEWFHQTCIEYDGGLEYSCLSCQAIINGANEESNQSAKAESEVKAEVCVTNDGIMDTEISKTSSAGSSTVKSSTKRQNSSDFPESKRTKNTGLEADLDAKAAKLRVLAKKGFLETFTHIFGRLLENKDQLGSELDPSIDLNDPEYFANSVEEHLFAAYSYDNRPTDQVNDFLIQYKNKFRSLQFNLKSDSNIRLRKRLFAIGPDSIKPEELVKLPTEELASDQIYTKATKASEDTLKNVFKPKIEIAMEPDTLVKADSPTKTSPENFVSPSATILSPKEPLQKKAPEARQALPPPKRPRESLESLLEKIETPQVELKATAPATSIDALLQKLPNQNPEFSDEPMNVDEETEKLEDVWKGNVKMPQVASFDGHMNKVGGTQVNPAFFKKALSSSQMIIQGRIAKDAASKYIHDKLSQNADVLLLEVHPSSNVDDGDQFTKLVDYFESKGRFGVVPIKQSGVKDLYLCPWTAGKAPPKILLEIEPSLKEQKNEGFRLFVTIVLATGYLSKMGLNTTGAAINGESDRPVSVSVQDHKINSQAPPMLGLVPQQSVFAEPVVHAPIHPTVGQSQPYNMAGQSYSAQTYVATLTPRIVLDPIKEQEFRQNLQTLLLKQDHVTYLKTLLKENGL
jgi:hypothetical protein